MGDTDIRSETPSSHAGYGSFGAGEIIAGPLVWGGLGWLADRAIGTAPWLFVVGALGGFAAGVYLLYMKSKRQPGSIPAQDEDQGTDTPNTREG